MCLKIHYITHNNSNYKNMTLWKMERDVLFIFLGGESLPFLTRILENFAV